MMPGSKLVRRDVKRLQLVHSRMYALAREFYDLKKFFLAESTQLEAAEMSAHMRWLLSIEDSCSCGRSHSEVLRWLL